MDQPTINDEANTSDPSRMTAQDQASISKIQSLLRAQDDTQRFVGLALLKSVLDNSPQLREDETVLRDLWSSLSAKFLDRLLRTGSRAGKKDSRQMLDLAVSVMHTFAILLPENSRGEAKFTDRIPRLVAAVLYSSEETTKLILQLLHTLVSSHQGAVALLQVEDLSALTEIAPSHAIVMDILSFTWLNLMTASSENKADLSQNIDDNVQNLASSFNGTDAVTFLEFLGDFFRRADTSCISQNPKWLKTAVNFIHSLVTSRPTPEARSAYTNAAASLLQAYAIDTSRLLFEAQKDDGKPDFSYLFINLLLIDIRASAPTLLEQLNKPGYVKTSRRLASSFDIICFFIGYLVKSLEDESLDGLVMSPDHLLKLRKNISEAMSVTIEYLRDRWDATFAGAMGLHLDARSGKAETEMGSRRTLTWDSLDSVADEDPLILSAVRTLALWLREDENEMLRKEASGLTDMFIELYQGSSSSSSSSKLDFRSPALVAMEALVTFDKGRDLLLRNNGWQILSKDLDGILQHKTEAMAEDDASRGIETVRVLLQVVEQTSSNTAEEWMDVVTKAAAWDTFGRRETPSATMLELQVAVLQLCCALLVRATNGMRNRYIHSTRALVGISTQLEAKISQSDDFLKESIQDALETLRGLSGEY